MNFGRSGDMSMSKMMEIATRYANGEEKDRLRSSKGKAVDNTDANSNRKQKRKVENATPAEAVTLGAEKFNAKAKAPSPPKKSKMHSDVLDQPCVLL